MAQVRRGRGRGPRVWIVLHCEVALSLEGWAVSEDVLFAASSKGAARRLMRRSRVDPRSWWRLEVARLDDREGTRAHDQPSTEFYSTAVQVIPAPPLIEGYRAAVLRNQRNAKEVEKLLSKARQEGRPGRFIANLKQCLRSIRRVLSRHRSADAARRFVVASGPDRLYGRS